MQNAIEFTEATKRYGLSVAVNRVSAAIPGGDVVGLLGHNGAGKTTLIKLALGLISPTTGQVSVLGFLSGTKFSVSRVRIGYLPENVAFYGNLTGREILEYLARLKRAAPNEVAKQLGQVGLGSAAEQRVRTYSKGMRQRLGLAQALLGSPDLLLLDEPTAGLDPIATLHFFELVHELRARGKTIVISSHMLAELELHLDRALILREGELVAHGTVSQMYAAAGLANTITARFSGSPNGFMHQDWLSELPSAPRLREPSVVELDVPAEMKLDVMRRLIDSHALSDVTMREPTLARLYAMVCATQAVNGREAQDGIDGANSCRRPERIS